MANPVVLQNTGMDSKKYGSFERYLLRVAEVCRDRGYHTVLQYESFPESDEYVGDLGRVGAEVVVAPSRGWSPSAVGNCPALIKKYRPSVIHNHFVGRYWKSMVPVVGRMAGADSIVNTIHNDPGYEGRSLTRFVYNRYDFVLPVSDAVRESLETGGVNPARLHTLYLGLFGDRQRTDEARQELRRELQIPQDATVLGCIAFQARFKGVDILLDAFRKVRETHGEVYLLQIGVDPRSEELPQRARDLGIDDRVVWAGIVDNGWRLLNAADAYVQPSRFGEGLPLALMEAMAMRLPIVSTRVAGNTEAIVDGITGIVSEPNPDALGSALSRLLDHPEHWGDLADAAHQRYLDHFDGESSVDKLVADYYGIHASAPERA